MDQKLKLPKLSVVNSDAPKKPKILLLSDDLRMHSGIATMSREFVIGTSDRFDWVQLGAALKHPDHGKVFDVSSDAANHKGISNASVKIYAHTGYGTPEVLRELVEIEKPDAILHFTDPRFWGWLYSMEHEIRTKMKIPLMYYNIWDSPPAPFWNAPFYESCDLIMNISKQTNNLVKLVLGENNYTDITGGKEEGTGDRLLAYVPHGINSKMFYPITEKDDKYEEYIELRNSFKSNNEIDFMFFWNNRNIRRKMMGDLVCAYKVFCDRLPKSEAKRVGLFMKTAMKDQNGTDIPELVRVVCPDYKVIFNEERLPTYALNMFYNIADVTINIASNEGFGLSSAESIMAGTPILNNVTGGLQDQVRFEDENGNWMGFDKDFTSNHTGKYTKHGDWAKVVYPSNRSLQGSLATPYIFDDRADFNAVADQMMAWYKTSKEERDRVGLKGREWLMSEESGMSAEEMSNRMADAIQTCLDRFKPKESYKLVKVEDVEKVVHNGIVW